MRLFLRLYDERAYFQIKDLYNLHKIFKTRLRTVGTPFATVVGSLSNRLPANWLQSSSVTTQHSSNKFASALTAPSIGRSLVFNRYYLDAIDIFLCHILSCVSWATKVKLSWIIKKDYGNNYPCYCVLYLFLNKIVPIQGSTIKIQLLSVRFSLIITTFAISELPQNDTKNKRGTREYTQQLIIKELNIPRMFG